MGYQTSVCVLHEFVNLDLSEICHPTFARKRSLQSMYTLVRIWAESFIVIATFSYDGYDHWL
ncbi:MAG: hypothetical protein F6K28_30950 [Microcoleus sp. SIO2G3]|nr:hypothetical protein [Microcoleus sp. SIO2G3]